MREVKHKSVRCPFCGRERDVTIISDDGEDWEGHHRGTPKGEERDEGCACPLGKIMHTHPPVKKMCLNCLHCDPAGACSNEDTLEQISKLFSVTGPVKIKDVTMHCENWELNTNIFAALLSTEEDMP